MLRALILVNFVGNFCWGLASHNDRGAGTALRADRSEQIRPFVRPIAPSSWARALSRPHSGDRVPWRTIRASSVNHTSTGLRTASGGSAAAMRSTKPL